MRLSTKAKPSEFGPIRRSGDPGIKVSRLKIGEIAQVIRLERTVFLEPLGTLALLARLIRSRTRYLAIRDGRRLAAYFGFEVYGPYAHVISNVTAPTHRRKGLARLLLLEGEQWAQAMGARCFIGEVRRSNRAQLDVLKGIGWHSVEVVPRFFRNGEDAIIVWRNFDAPRDRE